MIYHVEMNDGRTIQVEADRMCAPGAALSPFNDLESYHIEFWKNSNGNGPVFILNGNAVKLAREKELTGYTETKAEI